MHLDVDFEKTVKIWEILQLSEVPCLPQGPSPPEISPVEGPVQEREQEREQVDK